MRYLALILITTALSGGDIHRHGRINHFVPELYENPTVISFANGMSFDTRYGMPTLPDELQVERHEGVGYYLVQVTGPIIDNWKQEISISGGSVVGYIPNYTLIVRAVPSAAEEIRKKSFVRWVGIFQPAYKIPEELFSSQGIARITIQLFTDENAHEIAHQINNLGYKINEVIDHPLAKTVDATGNLALVNQIAKIPGVLWVQLWSPAQPANDDAQWVVQTGYPGTQVRRIWNEGIRGDGIVLCTSDTGVRTTHVVYYDASYPINNTGVYPNHRKMVAYKNYEGAAFGDVGSTYHGTHVSCTVAGDDSYNGGSAPYDGISIEAKLYFLDLANASGGFVVPENLTAMHDSIYLGRGLPYNILQHSASWRWWNFSGTYLTQDATTDAYCWANKEYLNIWAAGNEGSSSTTIGNPAIAKNVLTIGATYNGTSANQIASFSSRGPTQDGRLKPNVMAPGVDLISADGSGNTGYKPLSGTSMATPAANGAIGLIRQYLLAGYYPSGSDDPADSIKYQSSALLRSMAMVSADPNVGSYTPPDFNIGWGRIDVDSVLHFSGDLRKLIILDDTIGIGTGESVVDSFTVSSFTPLRVCLAWTDTAAAPNANPTLINDLNIELVDPSGDYYRGNIYSGGQSQQNPSSWDNTNVEECCRINNPELGTWTITISGANVPYAPQSFAYAVTGDIEPAIGIEEQPSNRINRLNFRLLTTVTKGRISLEITLPEASPIEINLLDPTGRRVDQIFRGEYAKGKELINHNTELPSGIYFVEVKTEEHHQVEKLLIIR